MTAEEARIRRKSLQALQNHNRASIRQSILDRVEELNLGEGVEEATHRGSQRGALESNESNEVASWSDVDLTTVTSTQQEPKKSKKRKWLKGVRRRFNDSGCDAWMCGVCGQAFTSWNAADQHEKDHIASVVSSCLASWDTNATSLETPTVHGSFRARGRTLSAGSTRNSRSQRKRFYSEDTVPKMVDQDVASFGEDVPEPWEVQSPVGNGLPRRNGPSEVRFNIEPEVDSVQDDSLLLSSTVRDYVVLADEALVNVAREAEKLLLTPEEQQAELELSLLTRDKAYYHEIGQRALQFKTNPTNRYRSDEKGLRGAIQNKFVDAYQLMKNPDGNFRQDHYHQKSKSHDIVKPLTHSDDTLFVNVMVKNSIEVVKHELDRLAKARWENRKGENMTDFERFRVYAHMNIVRLAGLALASDFTPRRIAIQLSNDLYRLLTPRLKRRGVSITTDIEYRVGPYFVIATNVESIHWAKLIRATYRDVAVRRAKWQKRRKRHELSEQNNDIGPMRRWRDKAFGLFGMSKFDVLAQLVAFMYHLHWIIYLPICHLAYSTFLGGTLRHFILSSVTDEIFYYVEEKGMEMEIEIRTASTQTAFMLSALRELRADGRELKKKRQESEKQDKGAVLGALLGPDVKQDKGEAQKPAGFTVPEDLEYVGLELDLPVGFRRLRWAMLAGESTFIPDAVYKAEAKYDDIHFGKWETHGDVIGAISPKDAKYDDFIGVERAADYIMPKSAFVKANRCSETWKILAYNDYCFCIRKKALTPEVPYGTTFIAWTQMTVIDTGNNSCKLICSVEPEFPNGPPLISRQIKSGMRAGTGELFVLLGTTISKYSDEYPS